jgi:hypothetical protein
MTSAILRHVWWERGPPFDLGERPSILKELEERAFKNEANGKWKMESGGRVKR